MQGNNAKLKKKKKLKKPQSNLVHTSILCIIQNLHKD